MCHCSYQVTLLIPCCSDIIKNTSSNLQDIHLAELQACNTQGHIHQCLGLQHYLLRQGHVTLNAHDALFAEVETCNTQVHKQQCQQWGHITPNVHEALLAEVEACNTQGHQQQCLGLQHFCGRDVKPRILMNTINSTSNPIFRKRTSKLLPQMNFQNPPQSIRWTGSSPSISNKETK